MPDIQILQKPVEQLNTIDQTFDLVYLDPPFGLQRDFTMQEENGEEKGFSDHWDSFDDYIDWYCSGISDKDGSVQEGTISEEIKEDLKKLGWSVGETCK